MKTPRVYIVEDDENIREMEVYAFNQSGFQALGFEKAEYFWLACNSKLPNLVILDIMLPEEDGLSILRSLRTNANTRLIPIIMITAKNTELDTVRGLDLGADDYIAKPFGVMEMISRAKALLRRSESLIPDNLSYGNIHLNEQRHSVHVGDDPIDLTHKEYKLLKYLMLHPEIALSREVLMDKVWGFEYEGESRTVDVHIKTLRQKLGKEGLWIKTLRNVGYKIGK